jgi:hypothetical protein
LCKLQGEAPLRVSLADFDAHPFTATVTGYDNLLSTTLPAFNKSMKGKVIAIGISQ